MRVLPLSVFAVALLLSCGTPSGNSHGLYDSSGTAHLNPLPDTGIYASTRAVIQTVSIPSWIHVDSIGGYKFASVSQTQARDLFPEDFEFPSGAVIAAFAKQSIDSSSSGIWYVMRNAPPDEEASPETIDLVLVIYGENGIATDAHYFATSGIGYGYSRIVDATTIREVFIDQMENVVVTTRTMVVSGKQFEVQDEAVTSFGTGDTAYPASQVFVKAYFAVGN